MPQRTYMIFYREIINVRISTHLRDFSSEKIRIYYTKKLRTDPEMNIGLWILKHKRRETAQTPPHDIREEIANYCSRERAVPWQDRYA